MFQPQPHGPYDFSDASNNFVHQPAPDADPLSQDPPIEQEYTDILTGMVGRVVFGQVVTPEDVAEQIARLKQMGLG